MPHLCVHFAVLEQENHRNQPLCMKGTVLSLFNIPVSLPGGKYVFLHGLTLSVFPPKMLFQHLNESITQRFSRGQNSYHTHLLSLSFSLTHSLTHRCACTHVNTYTHGRTQMYTFRHKKRPHSFSLCLCLWEQLNLSLRFYSGLKNREMVCGV